ncbi:NADP-dependent fatty aldehyde dehydrogenase domain protein, partial [Vibrio parahaemolyticus V-223/04]
KSAERRTSYDCSQML